MPLGPVDLGLLGGGAGYEVVRLRGADQVPIDQRPGYDPNSKAWQDRQSTSTGGWAGQSMAPRVDERGAVRRGELAPRAEQLVLGTMAEDFGVLGELGGRYRPAPAAERRIPYRDALATLTSGAEDAVTVKDPALLRGSFARGTVIPGGVRRVLTQDDIVRLRETGEVPRALSRGLARGSSPGSGDPAEYSDGTPRETLPISWSTGLPDEQRNRIRTTEQGGSSRLGAPTQVPVVWSLGNDRFEVRYVDPTRVVANRPIPESERKSAFDSDSYEEVTLVGRAQEALQEAKSQLIARSALQDAARAGRFRALPVRDRTQIGFIRPPGGSADTWQPVYAPTVKRAGADGWEEAAPLMMRRDVAVPGRYGDNSVEAREERAYRIGSPLNRDQDVLRQGLRDAFEEYGAGVQRVLLGNPRDPASLLRMQQALENGMEIRPVGSAVGPGWTEPGVAQLNVFDTSSSGALAVRLAALRGAQSGGFMAQPLEVSRGGQVVQTLLPEKDRGGRLTGRYLVASEQEVGPAALVSDPNTRIRGEKFARTQGFDDVAGLEGLATQLAGGSSFAQKFEPGVQTEPMAAILAKSLLTAEELASVPGLEGRLQRVRPLPVQVSEGGAPIVQVPAEIVSADSYARKLLEQEVHSLTGGRVPMSVIRERLAFGQRPAELDFAAAAPVATDQPSLPVRTFGWLAPGPLGDLARSMAAQSEGLDTPRALPMPASRGAITQGMGEAAATARAVQPGLLSRQLYRTVLQPDGSAAREPVGLPLPVGEWRSARTGNPYAPSYLDEVGAYMAQRASAAAPVVRDMSRLPVQAELDFVAAAPVVTDQLSLPVRASGGLAPSYLDDVERYMAAQAVGLDTPRALPTSDWAAARNPATGERLYEGWTTGAAQRPGSGAEPGQMGIPFQDIDPNRIVRSPVEMPVGKSSGPYAGAPYYGLGDGNQYQQAMSARGAAAGFDYGAMAAGLASEVGSPEHTMAMAQLRKRIQARQTQTGVDGQPGVPAVTQYGVQFLR